MVRCLSIHRDRCKALARHGPELCRQSTCYGLQLEQASEGRGDYRVLHHRRAFLRFLPGCRANFRSVAKNGNGQQHPVRRSGCRGHGVVVSGWLTWSSKTSACRRAGRLPGATSPVPDIEEAERDLHMAARRVLLRPDAVLQSLEFWRVSSLAVGISLTAEFDRPLAVRCGPAVASGPGSDRRNLLGWGAIRPKCGKSSAGAEPLACVAAD